MVIMNEQLFFKVESKCFKDFDSTLKYLCTHLSRFNVAKDDMKLYANENVILKGHLNSMK